MLHSQGGKKVQKLSLPCPKHNRKCNVFNGYNGNCIGFNLVFKFYLKKLMVHNGILMETIGISVMVSIGLLLFCF